MLQSRSLLGDAAEIGQHQPHQLVLEGAALEERLVFQDRRVTSDTPRTAPVKKDDNKAP